MTGKRALLIFAKYPEPGRVKTRLARSIGELEASRLYKKMVETVVERTRPGPEEYDQIIYFDPPRRKADFQSWFPGLDLKLQSDGNLGMRMRDAISETLSSSFGRVIVIGSDCLGIDRRLVCKAFKTLDADDIVIGPAVDGGYTLIGVKENLPLLFDDIPWSTSRVFRETLRRARQARLSVHQLPVLSDIDEIP